MNENKIVDLLVKYKQLTFIVVGFQNNHDGYSNIKKQARWFNMAFNELKRRYNFNNFKAVGHSNGGLIYTAFLENYFNTTSNRLIRIKVLMTIGSPYNFAETSNRPTQMLKDFIKNRKNLPSYLTMYSVAGTKNYVADGIVPVSSVEAGKYIYQGAVKHYTHGNRTLSPTLGTSTKQPSAAAD